MLETRPPTLVQLACALAGLAALGACGGAPPATPDAGGADAQVSDGGALDAGEATDAAGSDAGAADAGTPDAGVSPGTALGADVCMIGGAVAPTLALSADGAWVAYVACPPDASPAAVVLPSSGGASVELGAADPRSELAFAPDGAHLLVRYGSAAWLRERSGAAPAIVLGTGGAIEDVRFATDTTTGALRVLALERLGDGTGQILAYDRSAAASGYDAPRTLVADATLSGGLDLVTESGSNVLYEIESGGASRYGMVALDGLGAARALDVDPTMLAMGVIGLGNTHGIARRGGGLAFVAFDDGTSTELVAAGLPAGGGPLFVVADAASSRYAYFLVDGDPSRRLRNGAGPLETLAAGDGEDMVLSPAGDRLFFAQGSALASVGLEGGASGTVIAERGTAAFHVAVAPDGARVAALVGLAGLRRATSDGTGDTMLDATGVVGPSIGWSADGATLLWRRALELRAADADGETGRTVAPSALAWWAIPGSGDVVYVDGARRLYRVTP